MTEKIQRVTDWLNPSFKEKNIGANNMPIPKAILIAKKSCAIKASLKRESPFFRNLFATPLRPLTHDVNTKVFPAVFVEVTPGLPPDLVDGFCKSRLF
jgi:hypothetical protein